jgi:hypothetical protein
MLSKPQLDPLAIAVIAATIFNTNSAEQEVDFIKKRRSQHSGPNVCLYLCELI